MHTNDVGQITVPPEDNEEHVVEFGERHVIGDRDQADDHRAHLAQNRSQNQALEARMLRHYVADFCEDAAEIRIPVEHDHGRLRVPPAQI